MQVREAPFQAEMSLNEQTTDLKSHTIVRISYTISPPVLSLAKSVVVQFGKKGEGVSF